MTKYSECFYTLWDLIFFVNSIKLTYKIFSHFLIKLNVGIAKEEKNMFPKWGNTDFEAFQIDGLEQGMQVLIEKVRQILESFKY
jgi:hypothetical protein